MVAVMQLNGEGTAVDVAAARKSLANIERRSWYGDELQLDKIIQERERAPKAKPDHVDFCDDVAGTTPTLGWCQARELEQEKRAKNASLKQLRGKLDRSLWPAFDRVGAAFEPFAKADANRAYQEYIEGTIRGQFALDQEKLVRDDFAAVAKILTAEASTPPSAPRPFAAADAELNAVYRDNVRSLVSGWEQEAAAASDKSQADTLRQYASDYRSAAHAAQHEWLRYREAAAKLAAARWPKAPGVEDLVRARVTEDRIRELRNDVGGH